jgi:hypothetical protein
MDCEQQAGVTAISSSSGNCSMQDLKERDVKEATIKGTNVEEKIEREKSVKENDPFIANTIIANTLTLSSPPSTTTSDDSKPSVAKGLALPEQRGINDTSRQLRRMLLLLFIS